MDIFLTFAFLFSVGCSIGWIIELFYRRFFSAKRWLNPGFLVGPYLPLYGFGLCLLYLLASLNFSFLPIEPLRVIVRILLIGISMTAIEYLAGKIFIIGMKVKLWDYSKKWGNVEGLICPEFSLYWTLLGGLYCFLIHPFFTRSVDQFLMHPFWYFAEGMYYGILLVDVFWSMRLLTRIRQFAKENHIVVRLEEFKKTVAERTEKHRFWRFVFSLQEKNRSTADSLREYLNRFKQFTEEKMHKIVKEKRKAKKQSGKEHK